MTCREPHTELAVLKLGLDNPARQEPTGGIEEVVKAVTGRVNPFKSANGNGAEFWVRMTVWECKASVKDVENENLVKLDRVLHLENAFLAPDQKAELSARLLRRVFGALMACGRTEKDRKRIKQADLRAWMVRQVVELTQPASAGRSDTLEAKMRDAGYEPGADEVETAKQQRREYRQAILRPRFLDLRDRAVLESEVQARLCRLKAQLDAGEFSENGLQFHSRCLKELESLRETVETKRKPPVGLLYGLMYEIMNRCQHRLVGPST